MKTIVYNKLVRDKIPEIIRKNGGIPASSKLTHKRFVKELKQKLIEEARELISAKSKKASIEELSDVLEVLQSIAFAAKIAWGAVEKKRKEKNTARGGFKKKIFLEHVKE